jgi:hypothetical protein
MAHNKELMDDFFSLKDSLESPKSDKEYGILNIINSYRDREDDYLDRYKDVKTETTKTYEDTENSMLFTNSYIQNSIIRMNIIKKYLGRKAGTSLKLYFDVWRKNIFSFKRGGATARDYLGMNRKVIEDFCNKEEHSYTKSTLSYRDGGQIGNFATVLRNKLRTSIKGLFDDFVNKLKDFNNSKKTLNHYLTLLYLFTQLTIAKNKKGSGGSDDSELRQKLHDNEKKILKLEKNLNEKAEIISRKNDTIEIMTGQIESLDKKITKLEDKLSKQHDNLNIITESFCQRCGNSLEESFISTPKNKEHISLSNDMEYKQMIQEQLDIILKLEQDCKDLRNKNMDYKSQNEMIRNELEIIKIEFKSFSDNIARRSDTRSKEVQTETVIQTNVVNNTNIIVNKTKTKKTKPVSSKFPSKPAGTTTSVGQNSSSSVNFDFLNENKEVQSLKYDNSIMSQEMVNLNKELTKLRTESKQIAEINKKLEKEKADLIGKFKQKIEGYDKVKKENEELMILIQTSNYKPFITSEVSFVVNI